MMRLKYSRGFTLVELMVTIAVMAIIAMIAVPSFTQTIRKSQLNSDTREFVNLLAETRSEAIFKQNNRILKLDTSTKKWEIYARNQSDTADEVVNNANFWQMSNVERQSGDTSITFNRLGQATGGGNGQCFIFEHKSDATLKSYVYVQKGGTVLYNKTATACPT